MEPFCTAFARSGADFGTFQSSVITAYSSVLVVPRSDNCPLWRANAEHWYWIARPGLRRQRAGRGGGGECPLRRAPTGGGKSRRQDDDLVRLVALSRLGRRTDRRTDLSAVTTADWNEAKSAPERAKEAQIGSTVQRKFKHDYWCNDC